MVFYVIDWVGFVYTQMVGAHCKPVRKAVNAHVVLSEERKGDAEREIVDYIYAYIRFNRLIPKTRCNDAEVMRVARTRVCTRLSAARYENGIPHPCTGEFEHLRSVSL